MKLDHWQFYTPPPLQKKCFIGLRSRASLSNSDLSGRRGRNAHAYQPQNNFLGGYNAAKSLISRDIAQLVVIDEFRKREMI